MKKFLKIIVLMVMLILILVLLTGCGNKLVAIKTTSGYGDDIDNIATYEVKFKEDKADYIKITFEYNIESEAKDMEDNYKKFPQDGVKVKRNGKKVTIEASLKDYNALMLKGQSKEEVKKIFEHYGYEVK